MDLPPDRDPLVRTLRQAIHAAVRVLAVLMTVSILLGVVDVGWELVEKLALGDTPGVLTVSELLSTFGAFMAVLIAIEIFVNIVLYLRDDVIHVKIVLATALMAIARKVIVLDFEKITPPYVLGVAAVILATAIAYGIVHKLATEGATRAPG